MSSLFCCDAIEPFRPQHLSHEPKFKTFMDWAAYPKEATPSEDTVGLDNLESPFVIQLVRQVNYGPLESKRYFANVKGRNEVFVEVKEDDLIQANFQKLNSFKNYRCERHNKFFEVNVYQKDPVNKHHWRANLARPASSIDLEKK